MKPSTQYELAALREENADALAVNRTLNVQMDALREELAERKQEYGELSVENDHLLERASAAEQRNAHAEQWGATLERAIFRALDDSSEDAETGTIEIMRCDYEALAILIGEPVDAAEFQPTESGASEQKCCERFPKCVCGEGADGL